MRLLNNLTRRERIIVYVTAALAAAAVVYFGYLDRFITRYETVSADLAAQTERLATQNAILAEGEKVDQEFTEIENSLPKTREGKGPDMVFAEDMEELFKNLGLPTPNFGTSNADPADVEGFSYQWIPILQVRGDMAMLTKLMKSLAQRKLKIRTLHIRLSENRRDRNLDFDIQPAQLIRDADLAKGTKPRPKPGAATAPESDEL